MCLCYQIIVIRLKIVQNNLIVIPHCLDNMRMRDKLKEYELCQYLKNWNPPLKETLKERNIIDG